MVPSLAIQLSTLAVLPTVANAEVVPVNSVNPKLLDEALA
jgi:hypothetical protein